MEALIVCIIPSLGAYALRVWKGAWQALVLWLVLLFCAFAVLMGAGWSFTNVSIALLVASFIGAFADEIFGGIREALEKDFRAVVITAAICVVLFLLGRMWMLGNENDHRTMVQGTIVLIVFGGFTASLFGGKGDKGGKKK